VRKINGVTYTDPRHPRVWGHCDFFESFHEVEVAEGSRLCRVSLLSSPMGSMGQHAGVAGGCLGPSAR
jgi:hypothetical protein